METTIEPTLAHSRLLPTDHPSVKLGKVGLLLVNLGTPDDSTPAAVKRYLHEFLSDEKVIDYPRWLWLPILHGIILRTRPHKTSRNYQKIWRVESNESPLRYFTRRQCALLQEALHHEALEVDWAMRYGNPSIKSRLQTLQAKGCDRIVLFPLYPQYSATTTGTAQSAAFSAFDNLKWQPALRTVPPFHDDPHYIEALANSLTPLMASATPPERVIISFHGLPERYLHAGDPYHCQCHKTARLLREKLGWDTDFAPLGFQSIFGREKWLDPKTEDLTIKAAQQGMTRIAVITPGFVADCIETLEEVSLTLAEQFQAHGGQSLTALPCLNDSEEMIRLLVKIAQRELSGWLEGR